MAALIANEAWEQIIRVPIEPDYDRAALLIIDFQYLTASREHGMFAQLRQTGLENSAEYAISRIESEAVPNTRRLADAFRSAGLLVCYARSASLPS